MDDSKMKSVLVLLGAVLTGFAVDAFAHQGPQGNPGYITDSNGHIALDGAGDCLRSTVFNKARHGIAACGDAEAPQPVAAAAEPQSPAPATAPPAPPAPVLTTGSIAEHVLFDTDSASLGERARQALQSLVSTLKSFVSVDAVTVHGHTDSTGSERYNQALSERRAQAVADYLRQSGLTTPAIRTVGHGESEPAVSNATREGRHQNRRAEVQVNYTEQSAP